MRQKYIVKILNRMKTKHLLSEQTYLMLKSISGHSVSVKFLHLVTKNGHLSNANRQTNVNFCFVYLVHGSSLYSDIVRFHQGFFYEGFPLWGAPSLTWCSQVFIKKMYYNWSVVYRVDLRVLTFSCDLCRLFIALWADGEKRKKLNQWFPNLFRRIFWEIILWITLRRSSMHIL